MRTTDPHLDLDQDERGRVGILYKLTTSSEVEEMRRVRLGSLSDRSLSKIKKNTVRDRVDLRSLGRPRTVRLPAPEAPRQRRRAVRRRQHQVR